MIPPKPGQLLRVVAGLWWCLAFTPTDALSSTPQLSHPTVYPPLSREEVQSLLDRVPLYAVADPATDGLVFVKETNNPNTEIGYFFFSPEAANSNFKSLREKNYRAWEVRQYPLGLVWAELLLPSAQPEPVEYRLVPNHYDWVSAQRLVQRAHRQPECLFRAKCNEIPVFVNLQNSIDPQSFQLYMDYQQASRELAGATTGATTTLTALNLLDWADQLMRLESDIDFRNAQLIPSTTSPNYIVSATQTQWDE